MYVCVCVQAYLVYTSHDRGNASHDLFQGLDGPQFKTGAPGPPGLTVSKNNKTWIEVVLF